MTDPNRRQRLLRKAIQRFVPEPILRPIARLIRWDSFAPMPGQVRFASLRRTAPISRHWGWDRGQPVDRHFIERFLESHASDVKGRVLEAGDRSYTTRYGGNRVVTSDVLHPFEGNPEATIVGDLNTGQGIPSDAFDCIVLTETLQLLFEVRDAMTALHRALRPGGVLLATVPGITHTGDETWRKSWYWMFTAASLRRIAEELFEPRNVDVQQYGNVLSATAFLYGLSASELEPAELNIKDLDYPVVLTLRAVK